MFELGTDGPRNILVGVDGSPTSMRAGAYAGGLARRQRSHLVIVYVRPMAASVSPDVVVASRATQDRIAADLRDTITEQAARLGLEYTLYEREGNPYTEITKLADELRVDAVVVGASTKAGHRLIGSLATHLVRDARWPVTVVP